MSGEFTIGPDGVARLTPQGLTAPAAAAAAALTQVERVEAEVATDDRALRRGLHRAGFRLEGVRRRGWPGAGDAAVYARLREDEISGAMGFTGVMNSVLPRTRVIAHVLFSRASAPGQYLFCETTFKRDWELPGGVVERAESPRAGAAREVAEELGLSVEIGPLLAVDWLPPALAWDDAVELIFAGGALSEPQLAAMVLQPSEIAAVHWRSPDQAYPMLRPGAARRLRLITENAGQTLYLEDGDR